MDLIFEEEVDEVGSDIEAYCPKCRADTTHVVITKYEDEIRRVQCNPCGDVHSYRKPRGEMDDEPPEPLAVKKRAQLKKPTFEEYVAASRKSETPRPYGFRETYANGDLVSHPKFGLGYVSELLSDDKLEITFKDGRRILVHNRKDLPEPAGFQAEPPPARKPEKAAAPPRASSKAHGGRAQVAASRVTTKPAARPKAKGPAKTPPSRPAASRPAASRPAASRPARKTSGRPTKTRASGRPSGAKKAKKGR
ncbi:MAG TPA: hypothetical protein VGQ83_28180 [Polyangia bacterium]|jgi:hypothetical protein